VWQTRIASKSSLVRSTWNHKVENWSTSISPTIFHNREHSLVDVHFYLELGTDFNVFCLFFCRDVLLFPIAKVTIDSKTFSPNMGLISKSNVFCDWKPISC
jgi:hypothetical protein